MMYTVQIDVSRKRYFLQCDSIFSARYKKWSHEMSAAMNTARSGRKPYLLFSTWVIMDMEKEYPSIVTCNYDAKEELYTIQFKDQNDEIKFRMKEL